jgi:hypothetical protein
MIRILALVALVACKTRTIELGADAMPDAAPDASHVCRCRIPCPTATATTCATYIAGSTCGIDNFCVGSLGVCTSTTPQPCTPSAIPSVCRANDTSIQPCPF